MRRYGLPDIDDNRDLSAFLESERSDGQESAEILLREFAHIVERGDRDRLIDLLADFTKVPAAAYGLLDRRQWADNLDVIASFKLHALPASMELSSYLAAYYLSTCLLTGRYEDARALGGQLRGEMVDPVFPFAFVARTLAALARGYNIEALSALAELTTACERRAFDRFDCHRYIAWAQAAEAVAKYDSDGLTEGLRKLSEISATHLQREFRKWNKGYAAEMDASLFWDHETAGLLAYAARINTAIGVELPFVDMQWCLDWS